MLLLHVTTVCHYSMLLVLLYMLLLHSATARYNNINYYNILIP